MVSWEEAVEFCKSHYKNCYNCPISGACWVSMKDKIVRGGRTSRQYEQDIIAALEEFKNGKRFS